mmetsp:Transcript_62107/g.165234  ORF Transcript_62107/g.165234 Transcript_62107/m.165234 type:complete len:343 (-) Transcript_62107:1800-2828(-)
MPAVVGGDDPTEYVEELARLALARDALVLAAPLLLGLRPALLPMREASVAVVRLRGGALIAFAADIRLCVLARQFRDVGDHLVAVAQAVLHLRRILDRRGRAVEAVERPVLGRPEAAAREDHRDVGLGAIVVEAVAIVSLEVQAVRRLHQVEHLLRAVHFGVVGVQASLRTDEPVRLAGAVAVPVLQPRNPRAADLANRLGVTTQVFENVRALYARQVLPSRRSDARDRAAAGGRVQLVALLLPAVGVAGRKPVHVAHRAIEGKLSAQRHGLAAGSLFLVGAHLSSTISLVGIAGKPMAFRALRVRHVARTGGLSVTAGGLVVLHGTIGILAEQLLAPRLRF